MAFLVEAKCSAPAMAVVLAFLKDELCEKAFLRARCVYVPTDGEAAAYGKLQPG